MSDKRVIAVACDHGGFHLKEALTGYLAEQGLEYQDFGCYSTESVDYPLYAAKAARAVASGKCQLGLLICTTGIGISIAANKIDGVRCALCHEPWSAEMTRRHNNANMLAIGAGVTGEKLAVQILEAFLRTDFEGGRHQRRVDLITQLERENKE